MKTRTQKERRMDNERQLKKRTQVTETNVANRHRKTCEEEDTRQRDKWTWKDTFETRFEHVSFSFVRSGFGIFSKLST